jgi:hypothetical protein
LAPFKPDQDPAEKNNFSRHFFIDPDGKVTEVIRLNVLDDRMREEIVAYHFCQQFAKLRYSVRVEQPQFYVVGRDCPWDFQYVMHDGHTFFLEICRVADENLLRAIRAENDFQSLIMKDQLRGFEIIKIERNFPGTFDPDLVKSISTRDAKQKLYDIQRSVQSQKLFLRPTMWPHLNLAEALKTAIRKKMKKRHANKADTTIVIDNLTTHSSPSDFHNAAEEIQEFLRDSPFESIWIYTGYYSDTDGGNCEYTLLPIKLNDADWATARALWT